MLSFLNSKASSSKSNNNEESKPVTVDKPDSSLPWETNAPYFNMIPFINEFTEQHLAHPIYRSGDRFKAALVGPGYFILKNVKNGEQVLTRFGAFQPKAISENKHTLTVIGFDSDFELLAYKAGQLTRLEFDMRSPCLPRVTTNIKIASNINANYKKLTADFIPFFTPDNIPSVNSYHEKIQITVYNAEGKSQAVKFYFINKSVTEIALHISVDDYGVTPDTGFIMTFDDQGECIDNFIEFTYHSNAENEPIQTIKFDCSQFTFLKAPFKIYELQHNGFPTGEVTTADFINDGSFIISFSNQKTHAVTKVALGQVDNPLNLKPYNNNRLAWQTTPDSGELSIGTPMDKNFAVLMPSALESIGLSANEAKPILNQAFRYFSRAHLQDIFPNELKTVEDHKENATHKATA